MTSSIWAGRSIARMLTFTLLRVQGLFPVMIVDTYQLPVRRDGRHEGGDHTTGPSFRASLQVRNVLLFENVQLIQRYSVVLYLHLELPIRCQAMSAKAEDSLKNSNDYIQSPRRSDPAFFQISAALLDDFQCTGIGYSLAWSARSLPDRPTELSLERRKRAYKTRRQRTRKGKNHSHSNSAHPPTTSSCSCIVTGPPHTTRCLSMSDSTMPTISSISPTPIMPASIEFLINKNHKYLLRKTPQLFHIIDCAGVGRATVVSVGQMQLYLDYDAALRRGGELAVDPVGYTDFASNYNAEGLGAGFVFRDEANVLRGLELNRVNSESFELGVRDCFTHVDLINVLPSGFQIFDAEKAAMHERLVNQAAMRSISFEERVFRKDAAKRGRAEDPVVTEEPAKRAKVQLVVAADAKPGNAHVNSKSKGKAKAVEPKTEAPIAKAEGSKKPKKQAKARKPKSAIGAKSANGSKHADNMDVDDNAN